MKIRFYPKKSVLVGHMTSKLEDLVEECSELSSSLEEQKGRSVQFQPEIDRVDRLLQAAEAERDQVQYELSLLESHTPEEVMAEIEL